MTGRYRWRTAIRRRTPWPLLRLGFAAKGTADCGDHEWYRHDRHTLRCHHCEVGERVAPR